VRKSTSEETLVKSLTGTWRAEHLFLLAQAHADYLQQLQAIAACDQELDRLTSKLPQRSHDDGSNLPPKRPTGKHDFSFDAQRACYRITGVDLASIDGIGPNTALSFLGEVGFNLSAWPTAKAFCCWLGLCPNPKRSGGKNHGNLPTTANRAAQMLKDAAMGLRGAKQNPLARYYAKLAVRRGSAQALKAVAHKLARIIYALFKNGAAYDRTKLVPPTSERTAKRMIQRLAVEAGKLGYSLQKTIAQPPGQQGATSC
jgi:transposase